MAGTLQDNAVPLDAGKQIMFEIGSFIRAAVVAVVGILAPASDAPAADMPVEPVVVTAVAQRSNTVGVGSHGLDEVSIQQLRALGVRHVRTTLYWNHWGESAYRQSFAEGIRRAVAAGLEPLVVVHQQPSGGYPERRQVYRDFARFMSERAAEFPEVRYWQLWNEMDVAFTEIFGATRNDVGMRQRGRNYAEMLQLAYPAIKQANPRAVVVTGGIASEIGGGFLAGMYEGRAQYDVLAIHTYGFPVWPMFRERGQEARALMRRHGDTRPLWNTEFGMEAGAVPPGWAAARADIDRYHLDSWRSSVEGNHRERIYDRIYGHVLKQGGDLSYDLVRSDGSPRPAYSWLRSWLRGS
jgi:hypothetical protein